MLIVTRLPAQGVRLLPGETLPDVTPIGAIKWPVQIFVLGVRGKQVRLGIECDDRVAIKRDVSVSEYPGNGASASAALRESLRQHTDAAIAAVEQVLRIVEENTNTYACLQEAQAQLCLARVQLG